MWPALISPLHEQAACCDRVIYRNYTPCPDSASRTIGGWCQAEYEALHAIINGIDDSPAQCGTMRSTLSSWLQNGRIQRADLPPGVLGEAYKAASEEFNNGSRLFGNMQLDFSNAGYPYDWGSTLRHEFGHVYENIPLEQDGRAEEYRDFCRGNPNKVPPPEPSGPQVNITFFRDSIDVGASFQAQSDCTGTAQWSLAAGSSVSVTASGGVQGVSPGTSTVRVDCRGTNKSRSVAVYAPTCSLDAQTRLASNIFPLAPPVLDLTEADCDGGAPSPSQGGMGEDGEMDCYAITAHVYIWIEGNGWVEWATYVVSYICFIDGHMT